MHIRTFLKPFSFLPAILIMYMIFSFSSQSGEISSDLSYRVSYQIVKTADRIFDTNLEDWKIQDLAERYHGTTRKIAHMGEYCLLAISLSFPLYVYGMHGLLLMFVAGVFSIAFACTDEYHQSFIAGRSPQVKDVCIDTAGILIGIILVRIVGFIGRKTVFRPVKTEYSDDLSRREIKRLKKKQAKIEKKIARQQFVQEQAEQRKAIQIGSTPIINNVATGLDEKQTNKKKRRGRHADTYDERYVDRRAERRDVRYDNRQDARFDDRYDNRQDVRFDDRYDDRRDARYDDRYDERYDERRGIRYDGRYDEPDEYYDSRMARRAEKKAAKAERRERRYETSDELDDDMPLSHIFRHK